MQVQGGPYNHLQVYKQNFHIKDIPVYYYYLYYTRYNQLKRSNRQLLHSFPRDLIFRLGIYYKGFQIWNFFRIFHIQKLYINYHLQIHNFKHDLNQDLNIQYILKVWDHYHQLQYIFYIYHSRSHIYFQGRSHNLRGHIQDLSMLYNVRYHIQHNQRNIWFHIFHRGISSIHQLKDQNLQNTLGIQGLHLRQVGIFHIPHYRFVQDILQGDIQYSQKMGLDLHYYIRHITRQKIRQLLVHILNIH